MYKMTIAKCLLFVTCVFLIILSTHAQKEKRFFRKDYTYLDEASAFYKFHTVRRTWQEAKKICQMEGTSLWYPEDHAEMEVVLHFWNKTQPYLYIWLGISDLVAKGVYETIDGLPMSDVYHDWGSGEPNDVNGEEDCVVMAKYDTKLNDDGCSKKWNFFCKKPLLSLEWNKECDMPDIEYQYFEELGKCYKFHLTPRNWTDASLTCHSEQSYLAVINGKTEFDVLLNITAKAEKHRIKGDHFELVWLGFHNRDLEGWKTVRGASLDDSGFVRWGTGQPDGGDGETCGSMFYHGDYNDLGCFRRCFFICEHDVSAIDFEIDIDLEA